jgi:hypothetical protein
VTLIVAAGACRSSRVLLDVLCHVHSHALCDLSVPAGGVVALQWVPPSCTAVSLACVCVQYDDDYFEELGIPRAQYYGLFQ